jgi:O-acetyl-ADP-ribose deacetylase (regulator of RNase III)
MKLILTDTNPRMCAAWQQSFGGATNVEILCGPFHDLPVFDCLVCATNSFAFMDSGIDQALRDFFGMQIQQTAHQAIIELWGGELPVGACEIIETGHDEHPYLALTPTMRTTKPIAGSDVPYVAMWAMLNAARRHGNIETVACPGIGTAIGGYPADKAAALMALAWQNFRRPPAALTHERASQTELAINEIVYGPGS